MSILGITNRTENFKTAKTFAPFLPNIDGSGERRVRLVEKLLPKGIPTPTPDDIGIELFWYGMRDALPDGQRNYKRNRDRADKWSDIFRSTSRDLREKIDAWNEKQPKSKRFSDLNEDAYRVTNKEKLYNNLLNTEVDTVLSTPTHLLIGEAKYKSTFGTSSNAVLVHQLLRQYVMARILTNMPGQVSKTVVQFVVCSAEKKTSTLNTAQVGFMIDQDWLKEDNILTWEQIDDIAKG